MSEYYAVERTGDSLAHYGVRGMKWGVRKAIASGNTAKLGKQYKKAAKKLAKLEKRGSMGKKYAKRAALLGAGAAAAGGYAVVGTEGVAKGLKAAGKGISKGSSKLANVLDKYNGKGSKHVKAASKLLRNVGSDSHANLGKAAEKVSTWGKGKTPTNIYNIKNGLGTDRITGNRIYLNNNRASQVAAAGLGLGLAGAAGYNAYRAATAKRSREKAAKFRSEMNEAFAGTRYAGPGDASAVTPYKKKKRRNSARG